MRPRQMSLPIIFRPMARLEMEEAIIVLAVFHTKRDPPHLEGRS